jgi:hypothetical protein
LFALQYSAAETPIGESRNTAAMADAELEEVKTEHRHEGE